MSNNIATAISPTVALLLFGAYKSYDLLFWVAFITAIIGLASTASVKLRDREIVKNNQPLSLDRFILLKGWRQGAAMICYAFSYGVLATYIAIYGQEELGITGGTGLFFMLLAIGLILSRLVGGRKLRQGKVTQNASIGIAVSLVGYFIFAAVHNYWGYYGAALIIGLGNGHMFPAFQTMFINLATRHGKLYTPRVVGHRHRLGNPDWRHRCGAHQLPRHILDRLGRKSFGCVHILSLRPQALPTKQIKIK